jgi:hypothetical protein
MSGRADPGRRQGMRHPESGSYAQRTGVVTHACGERRLDAQTITVADSKTESGTRSVPLTDRLEAILRIRCPGRTHGRVWQSRYKGKHIGAGCGQGRRHIYRLTSCSTAPATTSAAGSGSDDSLDPLPGSFVLRKTGNLEVIMELIGQTDYRSALKYQHHGIEVARDVLSARHIPRHTAEYRDLASALFG